MSIFVCFLEGGGDGGWSNVMRTMWKRWRDSMIGRRHGRRPKRHKTQGETMRYEIRLKIGKRTYILVGLYSKLKTAQEHAAHIRAYFLTALDTNVRVYDVSGRMAVRMIEPQNKACRD